MQRIGRRCSKLYRRLCLRRSASIEDVKEAFRELSKEVHPDITGSNEGFIRIQEAYHVLSDPSRKRHYDQTGEWVASGVSKEIRDRQNGNDYLGGIFNDILTKTKGEIVYCDVNGTARNMIHQGIGEMNKNLEEINRTLESLDIIMDLIEYSGDTVNIFDGILLKIANENEFGKKGLIKQRDGYKAALEIIEDYEFNFRSKSCPPDIVYKITTTSTSW